MGRFAFQAIAFGYTPTSFKAEFGEQNQHPPGTTQAKVEESKRAKQDAMSRMVRKCAKAIYNVSSYSYFRDDLGESDARKCINPLDIVYSRPKDKWDRAILLALDQSRVTLPPLAQYLDRDDTAQGCQSLQTLEQYAGRRSNAKADGQISRLRSECGNW